MIILQNIGYAHPNKDLIFDNISLSVSTRRKLALVGNNGTGKSTLLKIIAGELLPASGTLVTNSIPYYVPQLFGQFNHLTIAQALHVDEKLHALKEILAGNVVESNLTILDDDWNIEDRCSQALGYWDLNGLDLSQKMKNLSGGQKTKVFLAGMAIHQPEIILLDEPSNHLDISGRNVLYDFIDSFQGTLIVVSHDRKLLNLLDTVCELSNRGLTLYGGNYDFYKEQKIREQNALSEDVRTKEKALRKAKEIERDTMERQQKLDARGRKKQEKEGLPKVSMNTLKNNAEKSTARIKGMHAEKVGGISQELDELRKELPDIDKMKFGFDNSALHKGKILVTARNINFGYGQSLLWKRNVSFEIISGQRIVLRGSNGSGKTSLIKIIMGEKEPATGIIHRVEAKSVYIDQDYSLIDNRLTVYEQADRFNNAGLREHEIKIRLNRFLFTQEFWNKPCDALSGGEKMRLMLCCLTINHHAPDMIILDEPTNNLDIQNIEILTAAINEYEGTLIVVSHDEYFLEQVKVHETIELQ